jgi:cobalt transporter subunit CbtA
MFYRVFASAVIAGLLAGLVLTGLQLAVTSPLILAAETFETVTPPAAPAEHHHGAQAAAPADDEAIEGSRRALFTGIATVSTGVGFALLLVAAMALRGRDVDARRGLLWGAAGFAVFALAPGFGLPPELPGSVAAELAPRQAWWIATAAATAIGLWGIAFSRHRALIAGAIVLIVLPHLVGAPHPPEGVGRVPPELAAHFTAASFGLAAVFWLILGAAAGGLYNRFGSRS